MKFGENLQGHITHEWRTQVRNSNATKNGIRIIGINVILQNTANPKQKRLRKNIRRVNCRAVIFSTASVGDSL